MLGIPTQFFTPWASLQPWFRDHYWYISQFIVFEKIYKQYFILGLVFPSYRYQGWPWILLLYEHVCVCVQSSYFVTGMILLRSWEMKGLAVVRCLLNWFTSYMEFWVLIALLRLCSEGFMSHWWALICMKLYLWVSCQVRGHMTPAVSVPENCATWGGWLDLSSATVPFSWEDSICLTGFSEKPAPLRYCEHNISQMENAQDEAPALSSQNPL